MRTDGDDERDTRQLSLPGYGHDSPAGDPSVPGGSPASEIEFRSFFENALVGLFRFRVRDGHILAVNREAARIFGYESPRELVKAVDSGSPRIERLLCIPDLQDWPTRDSYTFSSRSWRRDGELFWVQVSARYDTTSDIVEGAVRDVTDQVDAVDRLKRAVAETRTARDEAEEANRAKSRFLANISHEIRTPLNGIVGFSEIILNKDVVADVRDDVRQILSESDRLMLLINQLLDLSRIEAGRIRLETVPFRLRPLLENVVNPQRRRMDDKGLDFRLVVDPGVPEELCGDPLRTHQIFANLLSNAVKFTDRGRIGIRVKSLTAAEGRIGLLAEVSDTGIGIPAARLESIFEPFSQADESIARQFGGTGLGIPIARQLAEMTGGGLSAESVPGEGSVFRVELYYDVMEEGSVTTERRRHPRAVGPADLKGLRVLVAEDYPSTQAIVSYHLEKAGCEVHVAADGRDAVEAVETRDWDLILMDVRMPVMDGLEATRLIRSLPGRESLPIIGLTAGAYREDRHRCLSAGMDDYLSKPLRRQELLVLVARWCGRGDLPSEEPSEKLLTASRTFRYRDLLREMEGDGVLVNELLAGFRDEASRRMEDIRRAVDRNDRPAAHRLSHALKGGALNVMADILAERALRLERASRREEGDLSPLVSALAAAFRDFREVLDGLDIENGRKEPIL